MFFFCWFVFGVYGFYVFFLTIFMVFIRGGKTDKVRGGELFALPFRAGRADVFSPIS
jgi:hypothetical protein